MLIHLFMIYVMFCYRHIVYSSDVHALYWPPVCGLFTMLNYFYYSHMASPVVFSYCIELGLLLDYYRNDHFWLACISGP